MEVTGKIKKIGEVQSFGSNGFTKREVVIVTHDSYPQTLLFEFHKEDCSLLDQYNVDDDVKIAFNLRGREWVNPQGETKYFNSIQGWRIERL